MVWACPASHCFRLASLRLKHRSGFRSLTQSKAVCFAPCIKKYLHIFCCRAGTRPPLRTFCSRFALQNVSQPRSRRRAPPSPATGLGGLRARLPSRPFRQRPTTTPKALALEVVSLLLPGRDSNPDYLGQNQASYH